MKSGVLLIHAFLGGLLLIAQITGVIGFAIGWVVIYGLMVLLFAAPLNYVFKDNAVFLGDLDEDDKEALKTVERVYLAHSDTDIKLSYGLGLLGALWATSLGVWLSIPAILVSTGLDINAKRLIRKHIENGEFDKL